jgi:putative endonuclease
MTSNLSRRVAEHRAKQIEGFTAKYNITRLVYVESTNDARAAIAREKQIKGWRREKKIRLIESLNPDWCDLADSITSH